MIMAKSICPVRGCTTFGNEAYIQEHCKLPHTACSCGWAGRQWGNHKAQVARRAKELDTTDKLEHERIDMRWSDKQQSWLRISKWEMVANGN